MEFETIVYVKDFEEIAKAVISKPLVIVSRIEAVVFLLFYLVISTAIGNFSDFSNIVILIVSLIALVISFFYPRLVKRSICKMLVGLSGGQETITFRYALRGEYLVVHDVNISSSVELLLSDIAICKETKHYFIYFTSNKRLIFVGKSMKELDTFKRLFQPKKYYGISKR